MDTPYTIVGRLERSRRNRARAASTMAFAVIVGVATVSLAHQDMIFPISPTGELGRIPDQYAPASLKVQRHGSGKEPTLTVVLQLGKHRVEFPPCISRLFALPQGQEIRATGSWYHQRSLLPPYLNLELPRRSSDSGFSDGYSLLFNLETAELLEVREHVMSAGGQSVQEKQVALSSLCNAEEAPALTPKVVAETRPAEQDHALDARKDARK